MKLSTLGEMLKAIYAAAAAALSGLAAALVGAGSFGQVSDAQWVTIAVATLGAFGAVYGVTNSPAATGTDGGP